MTDLAYFPWALNQDIPEGYGYPAEALRAQHYAATSGGTGVDTPRALTVQAQEAADGTVQVLPGGATAASTYPGQGNQSYHAFFGAPQTVEIAPTGSSPSGRHDLVILRFIDPDHEQIPGYDGEYPIPAETAKDMRFFWIDVLQGRSATTVLDYPHVKLAHVRRGPNSTIARPEDIVDLRELANAKNHLHVRANNMQSDDYGTLSTAVNIWPTNATHTMRIPDFATRVQIIGNWSTVAADTTDRTVGLVHIRLIHPDGSYINTESSRFQNVRVGGGSPTETLNVVLADNRPVPEKFRGELVTVQMRGTKQSGPNIYMDGNSSWSVQLYFEQEIA